MSDYSELKRLATGIQSCQSISPSDEAAWMRRTTGEKVLLALEEIEEAEALRKDAERYRFLMRSSGSDDGHLDPGFYVIYEDGRGFGDIFTGEEASAEIDAAMSKGEQP